MRTETTTASQGAKVKISPLTSNPANPMITAYAHESRAKSTGCIYTMTSKKQNIHRLTPEEATSMLGCPSITVEENMRTRLMLGKMTVKAFFLNDIQNILGADFRHTLDISSISWRMGAALIEGAVRAISSTTQLPYYVVLDVDALRHIAAEKPAPVKRAHYAPLALSVQALGVQH